MIYRLFGNSTLKRCSPVVLSDTALKETFSVNEASPLQFNSYTNKKEWLFFASSNRYFSSLPLPLPKNNDIFSNVQSKKVIKTVLPHTRKTEPDSMISVRKEIEPSPNHIAYAGNKEMPITSELKIITSQDDTPPGVWPVFRMMDENGHFRKFGNRNLITLPMPPKHDIEKLRKTLEMQHPQFASEFQKCSLFHQSKNIFPDTQSKNTLLRAHRQMIRLRKMDTILHSAQRQGRISFYMTCHGEEGIHIGSASALKPQDFVFAQYREAGILSWRGFTLEQFCNQCFSNDLDLGKGRQMPVHYGTRALNYQTISSPLGTQLPQAVGAAYKLKLDARENPDIDPAISIAYFGDGAASSVDFHSACNFAATLRTPMIFFCRNNGYAISTPVTDQYAGDGIISRAPGYGMAGIRVDGNDIFAVHSAVRAARELALETSSPVMIEAMTYRQGHHSTSDDSTRYRDSDEVKNAIDISDPMVRFNQFLKNFGWMNDSEIATIEDEERKSVLKAMKDAEVRPHPKLDTMFEDVYHEKPPHLIRQEDELKIHMSRNNLQYQ